MKPEPWRIAIDPPPAWLEVVPVELDRLRTWSAKLAIHRAWLAGDLLTANGCFETVREGERTYDAFLRLLRREDDKRRLPGE